MAECHMSHASDVYTCCEAAGSKILGLLDKKGAEDIIWGHVNLRAIKRPTRQRERERECVPADFAVSQHGSVSVEFRSRCANMRSPC